MFACFFGDKLLQWQQIYLMLVLPNAVWQDFLYLCHDDLTQMLIKNCQSKKERSCNATQ